jgi:hypothetical protein
MGERAVKEIEKRRDMKQRSSTFVEHGHEEMELPIRSLH